MKITIGFWIIPLIITIFFWAKWYIRESHGSSGSTGNLNDSTYEFILAITATLLVWLLYFASMYFLTLL